MSFSKKVLEFDQLLGKTSACRLKLKIFSNLILFIYLSFVYRYGHGSFGV